MVDWWDFRLMSHFPYSSSYICVFLFVFGRRITYVRVAFSSDIYMSINVWLISCIGWNISLVGWLANSNFLLILDWCRISHMRLPISAWVTHVSFAYAEDYYLCIWDAFSCNIYMSIYLWLQLKWIAWLISANKQYAAYSISVSVMGIQFNLLLSMG